MKNTQDFIQATHDRFLAELFELLRLPSISADPAYAGSVRQTAEWVAASLRNAGADHVRLEETAGFPIVYG
jgi:acetylornithine deacetylase/succinyl-diaminopimelate desuccinylase-like protein